jgi:hypothetical protein
MLLARLSLLPVDEISRCEYILRDWTFKYSMKSDTVTVSDMAISEGQFVRRSHVNFAILLKGGEQKR